MERKSREYGQYIIDESRVYISGASGGGETLSIILGKRPELFTSAFMKIKA